MSKSDPPGPPAKPPRPIHWSDYSTYVIGHAKGTVTARCGASGFIRTVAQRADADCPECLRLLAEDDKANAAKGLPPVDDTTIMITPPTPQEKAAAQRKLGQEMVKKMTEAHEKRGRKR